jgi:hypothetical protein
MQVHRRENTCEHSMKVAIYKPRRGAREELEPGLPASKTMRK